MSISFSAITGFVSGIFKPAADLIDNLHVSDEERMQAQAQLNEIKMKANDSMLAFVTKVLEAQTAIITTEMKGNWLQRSWRPILMLVIIMIVANNYLLMPFITAATGWGIVLELPAQLWNVLTVGVGGYVAGRSGEKIVSILNKKDSNQV
jgi:hypothetical protein